MIRELIALLIMSESSESSSNEKPKRNRQIFVCVFLILFLFCMSLYCGLYLPSSPSSQSYLLRRSSDEIAIVTRDEHEYLFSAFTERFQKRYDSLEEYHRRFIIFKESLSRIKDLRGQSVSAHGSALYGITKFADMTQEEFHKTMLINSAGVLQDGDYNVTCDNKRQLKEENDSDFNIEWSDLPLKFDWREKDGRNVVASVLDQGRCGSCYAHCVVGVMESMMMISNLTRQLQTLSIEELLDCSNYTEKCKGGNPVLATQFLCDFNLPIVSEEEYPLTNKNQACQLKSWPKSGVVLSRRTKNKYVDGKWIAWQIATHGPVVAIVNAHTWQYYDGGIIRYNCNGEWGNLNHVVQIVGYDRTTEEPHFISRNSWGADWGEEGYVKTAMTEDSYMCGIGTQIVTLDVAVV